MTHKIAVFDIGEYETRVGFAGQNEPIQVFPTVVDHEIPIDKGYVTNWDQIEKIIKKSFDTLNVKPEDTPVLITESIINYNKTCREKWTQILFDTFEIPSLYIASQPYLSLVANGRNTGMVLSVSEGSSYAVPVYESVPCKWALTSSQVTGKKITEYFIRHLNIETGINFDKPRYRHEISQIKEKYFYIAKDYDKELANAPVADWQNDDIILFDTKIPLNEQRFQCPELLFKPELNDNYGEVHYTIYDSIMKYPSEMRSDMCSNIFLSGGTTMMKGFCERLNEEFKKINKEKWDFQITAANDKNLVWKGGSIVADRHEFEKTMITKDEYEEYYSPTIVNVKCFT